MTTANTKVDLKRLPKAKVSALKRQAKQLGVSPDDYVLQLIEDGLELRAEALNTPWETLIEPFRKALSTFSDDELDALVEKARRSTPRKK